MDKHEETLRNLCRLCGKRIIFSKSCVNAKRCIDFTKSIIRIYGFDPEKDDTLVSS
jgi:hypothetical protein